MHPFFQSAYLRNNDTSLIRNLAYNAIWEPDKLPPGSSSFYLHGLSNTHRKFYAGIADAVRSRGYSGLVYRFLEHCEEFQFVGHSLRARKWRLYAHWSYFFLPVFIGQPDLTARREIFSHRCYDVPAVALSQRHRNSVPAYEIGPGSNGPRNMFGDTLSVTRRLPAYRHPVRWHRICVPWDGHARWNLSKFVANCRNANDWEAVARGDILPLDGEWTYRSFDQLCLGMPKDVDLYDDSNIYLLAAAIGTKGLKFRISWHRIPTPKLYILAHLIRAFVQYQRREYGRSRIGRQILDR